MTNWVFDQAPNVAAITLKRIILENGLILYISHDQDDDSWQFLDGKEMETSDAMLVGMGAIVKYDPTVVEVAHIAPGQYATRPHLGGKWTIGNSRQNDE